MKIIFCADPIQTDSPDSMYIDEVAAATRAGLDFQLVDYSAIANDQNAARAVRDIPVQKEIEPAVYRGWMLRASQYRILYDALLSRGIKLVNNEKQYRHTHHLPENYHVIEPHTPKTIWIDTTGKNMDYAMLMDMLIPFGSKPLILKDFVKSEKHYWNQATYISSASDALAVKNTVERFLELRGDDLEGGLVFREFIDFEPVGDQPRSGMPLSKEYRIFFLDALPIMTVRYWDVEGYDETLPPRDLFADMARNVRSRFFTMDVAQRSDGTWMIIELGDGQVAGLPDDADENAFYKKLAGAT